MQKSFFGIAALAAIVVGGTLQSSHAAEKKVFVPVVAGAKALSNTEKGLVQGMGNGAAKRAAKRAIADCPPPPPVDCPPPPPVDCPPPPPVDCPPVIIDSKPGYGFGTTGHFGPPGQGFTPSNSWRGVVAGGGTTTPRGKALPPRAFR